MRERGREIRKREWMREKRVKARSRKLERYTDRTIGSSFYVYTHTHITHTYIYIY